MNILYLSYWSLEDPLNDSTVFPALRLLASFPYVKSIVFSTIERTPERSVPPLDLHEKIKYIPLRSLNLGPVALNKITDFVRFENQLRKICKREKTELIIARTALGGSLAMKVSRSTGIPYIVESFEPHAGYMLASGVWKKNGLRFKRQSAWEEEQKKTAKAIITVSEAYRDQLVKEGVPASKVEVVPCAVPLDRFRFDQGSRDRIRENRGYGKDTIVGIYSGKFGGLYLDEEAFNIFKWSFEFFGDNLRIVILTTTATDELTGKIKYSGLDVSMFTILKVPHNEVPDWLCAADFAYSFHREHEFSRALSPVKNGEYWACGLPVLCSRNIGDDSDIISKERGGAIFSPGMDAVQAALSDIKDIIHEDRHRDRIRGIAATHRNFARLEEVYKRLIIKPA